MKFKDFTQEAYDDIQSYMGGEEQWEEINKTYGVVETKGIFQYDYESQLRNAATEYQRQNEEASNSVRRMFDNVNGVDDLYAARFRDEYMDLERFSTAIKELAALINVRSVENIYTMDCQTLKTKAGNIQAKVDSKITEYYKERFYSVDSNGKTVMNWDEINYEMRKEFVPDAELQALVSVFPKLSTDDEEETIANIENMLRAGYGNAKDDECEDKFAKNIAKHIVAARQKQEITTTGELNEIIKAAIPQKVRATGGHPSKRTYQAIRIELNHERDVLRDNLDDMIDLLNPGGRICIITFHSLEDRIVKSNFKKNENPCTCPPSFPVCVCGNKSKGTVITRKPILPSEKELEENSRSKSAKLRVFEKNDL